MAHFAELDDKDIVTQVVVVNNAELMDDGTESETKGVSFLKTLFGHERWVQTSYNGKIRKNYAGLGFYYDRARDAFVPPRPFPSWNLDESTCRWTPPVPRPQGDKKYNWDEDSKSWKEINS